MGSRRRRSYSRDVEGLFPRLWRMFSTVLLWGWYHPQPILALFVVAAVLAGMWSYATQSQAFKIEHVSLPKTMDVQLPEGIEGKNIFEVDLAELAERIHVQKPWLDHVRVIRRLPDTLEIQPVPRIPVALLRMDGWYAVDTEGYVLPQQSEANWDGLPRLTGFQKAGIQLVRGERNRHERLQQALRVLKTLQTSTVLAGRRVELVDVADTDKIRFMLNGDLEVRCGREIELDQHLDRLSDVLEVVKERGIEVRYIDVRFKEPVVAPKDA